MIGESKMNEKEVVLSDYFDLLNLHKGLLEARFNENPDNFHVAGSPILANIHEKIIKALISLSIEKYGEDKWSEWLFIKNHNNYKEKVVKLITTYNKGWSGFSQVRKSEVLKDYLRPFIFDDNYIADVIVEIDKMIVK